MSTTRRDRLTHVTAVGLLAIALAGAAACGDTTDTADSPDESTTSTAADGAPIVDVTAADYRFDELPSEIEANTRLELRNESARELHELVAMRLADDEDRTAEELVALPEQELGALFAGPPALVLIAPPGEGGFVAVGNGALDEPGRYLFICFIPTGAEPAAYLDALDANPGQPPSVAGGPPHFSAGMYAEVKVR